MTISATAMNGFDGTAAPLRAGGILSRTYQLRILKDDSNEISVREHPIGRLLPAFCPTRHMNFDGTFCLGYEAGDHINGDAAAQAWWRKLEGFLLCQETAHSRRTWPREVQISHGAAGRIQLEAERVAAELDCLTTYLDAVRTDTGSIASCLWLVSSKRGRLVNGRAACVCGRRRRTQVLKLRRECFADGDACLVMLEVNRREAEKEFWRDCLTSGRSCCGTMDECPLAL